MAEPIILTENELKSLTGYRNASKQISWLENNNISHYVNGAQKPIVLRSTLTGAQNSINSVTVINEKPNFEAL